MRRLDIASRNEPPLVNIEYLKRAKPERSDNGPAERDGSATEAQILASIVPVCRAVFASETHESRIRREMFSAHESEHLSNLTVDYPNRCGDVEFCRGEQLQTCSQSCSTAWSRSELRVDQRNRSTSAGQPASVKVVVPLGELRPFASCVSVRAIPAAVPS